MEEQPKETVEFNSTQKKSLKIKSIIFFAIHIIIAGIILYLTLSSGSFLNKIGALLYAYGEDLEDIVYGEFYQYFAGAIGGFSDFVRAVGIFFAFITVRLGIKK